MIDWKQNQDMARIMIVIESIERSRHLKREAVRGVRLMSTETKIEKEDTTEVGTEIGIETETTIE